MQAGCYAADTHCVPSDLSSPALPAELANATGSLAVLLLPTESGNKQDPQNKDVYSIFFLHFPIPCQLYAIENAVLQGNVLSKLNTHTRRPL